MEREHATEFNKGFHSKLYTDSRVQQKDSEENVRLHQKKDESSSQNNANYQILI